MNYTEWLNYATTVLQANLVHDPYLNPKIDANLLLQAVTKKSKAMLFAFGETHLSHDQLAELTLLLQRRQKGEPIAYILGEKEFWSLPLKVSKHTLIPRPDTERVVEIALDWAYKRLEQQTNLHILDLGTGTGAIALALASELGDKAVITAVDIKAEAVSLAEENRQHLGFKQVTFLQSDWFNALQSQQFDLIVSNPPYIDKTDENLKLGDVRFEPLSALVSAQQGLSDLYKIIENAPLYLTAKGALILEHGWQQATAVQQFFQHYDWDEIQSWQDYAGLDRVTKGVIRAK